MNLWAMGAVAWLLAGPPDAAIPADGGSPLGSILALPEAERGGPRAAYRQVGDVFRQNAGALWPLQLEDITVKRPDESPFLALRGLVNPPDARSPIQFAGQRIRGSQGEVLDVEDSWIYRAS